MALRWQAQRLFRRNGESTAAAFPAGTLFSVKMNPLRDGSSFGSRVGAIAKCPWKTPPAPGKTCDTVKGAGSLGGATF